MTERDELLDRVAETLRAPVPVDRNQVVARVMSEVEKLPAPSRPASPDRVIGWLKRRRTIRLSPLGGLALATGFAALVLVSSRVLAPGPSTGAEGASVPGGRATVQFVLVAPEAGSVALVGDFNDWNRSATPLAQEAGAGVWSISVLLEPGRYKYSFLVDGSTWIDDPRAVPVVEDEFGRPSSMLTVGEL